MERQKINLDDTLTKTASTIEVSTRKAVHGLPRFKWKFSRKDNTNLKRNPESSYIVTMLFNNGTKRTFVVKTSKQTFDFRKKTYFLYHEESFFDLSLNQYHLFFHESNSVPINREIALDGDEAYFNVTPENLKQLIAMEYVKVLAGANSLDMRMRIVIILVAVNTLFGLLMVLKIFGKGV